MTGAAGIHVKPRPQAVVVSTLYDLFFVELRESSLEKCGLICVGSDRSKWRAGARRPATDSGICLGQRHSREEKSDTHQHYNCLSKK